MVLQRSLKALTNNLTQGHSRSNVLRKTRTKLPILICSFTVFVHTKTNRQTRMLRTNNVDHAQLVITQKYKKLIRRWDSVRELSLRRHRTRTTKYNRLVHKFRHRSTRLCVGTLVYQIQWNNAMQRPLRRSRSFKVTDFGTNRKLICDFLLVINTNLPPILHRFQVMADYWSNFR